MIIYKATNLINGKIYIGQTKNTLNERVDEHWNNRNCKQYKNNYFSNALKKYGLEGFEWEEFDSGESIEELNYLEKYWIKWYRSNNRKYGYNGTDGGYGIRGFKHSEKTKINHSKIMKEKFASGQMIPPYKGKKIPKNVKEKMSLARQGKPSWNKGIKGTHFSPGTEFKIGHSTRCQKIICIETGIIFNSIKDANKFFNLKKSHIGDVCRGKRNECVGFHWEFIEGKNND